MTADGPTDRAPEPRRAEAANPAVASASAGDPMPRPPADPPPRALADALSKRHRASLIWLVPVVAALVAGYLGWQSWRGRGPLVTVAFRNAEGLTAGQTAVRYKAVQVGTVERIRLNPTMTEILADIRMARSVEDRLTDRARFWVVRARLTAGGIAGIDTLVRGSYVEFDPGLPGGEARTEFTALEDPPGIRSDEAGRIFTLRARRLGSLDRGSPVFFRDVVVGEILGHDDPGLAGQVALRAFVRAPFDGYLRRGSRFWNVSGVNVALGPGGVRLELESLRALVAGGVAFDTPEEEYDAARAGDGAEFQVYESRDEAESATSPERLEFVTYFEGSVRGVVPGTPVELRGIRIGGVGSVQLEYQSNTDDFRVAVGFSVEPRRIAYPTGRPPEEVLVAARRMVGAGLRVQLRTVNIITGQIALTLDDVPGAAPAEVRLEGERIVLPNVEGGAGGLMGAASSIAAKLEGLPLDEIARNLNGSLAAVNALVGGPELRGALRDLAGTLQATQELVRRADGGLAPLMRRLPAIAANLETATARAGSAVANIEAGYGRGSEVNRQLERLLAQASDAARSVRLLADYLDRHPEALVRGRGRVNER